VVITVDTSRRALRSGLVILLLLALARAVIHILTNGQYGWHRDELALLDDARRLAWGYVAYPPITPALARVALELFGPSLVGVRLVGVLVQCAAMIVAGLIAWDLGGSRGAQVVAALAVATSAASLFMSSTLMYVSVDYLWWVLVAWCLVRRIRTDDGRWWLGVGAAIGLGMMTKYTMGFLVAGVVAGVFLTPLRRDLRSRWLWAGAALALVIFLPNLIWQVQHDFISLQFLGSIHERDVDIGRTDAFLVGQLYVCANALLTPLWLGGLVAFLFLPGGRRYRSLGWLYIVPLVLFIVLRGRDYYLAPAYASLAAGGAVAWEHMLAGRSRAVRRAARAYASLAIVGWGAFAALLVLPLAPVNSRVWNFTAGAHDMFREEIGWTDLVDSVEGIYMGLPEAERSRTGILAGNYGEAGAVNLYGPARGLPRAISPANSYWQQGFGDPPPETVIALGYQREFLDHLFSACEFVTPVTNPYGVVNEETEEYEGIFVCRGLRRPWAQVWPTMRSFG
jgi:4-amino-4-deoxy-L-arabinose transferase-like glycosyltransferase